jgi:hypothetical protein
MQHGRCAGKYLTVWCSPRVSPHPVRASASDFDALSFIFTFGFCGLCRILRVLRGTVQDER